MKSSGLSSGDRPGQPDLHLCRRLYRLERAVVNRITGAVYASSDTGGVFEIDRTTGAILHDIANTAGSSIGTDLAVQADTIPNPVPEPASLGLLGIGLAGIRLLRRGRRA